MKKLIPALVLATVFFCGRPAIAAGDQPEKRQTLTLRIYNYAQVQAHVLDQAKRESNRIFNQLGIETNWLDCPTSPEQIAANSSCAAKPGPDHLILNLLPKSMSKKYGFKRGIFGFALPTAKGMPGNAISLFFDSVLDLAYYGGVGTSFRDAQAIILGHMIVHEVGHLLLGPNSHSSEGVMSFPWNKRTLTDMERGRLTFTPTERSKIDSELLRRYELLKTWAD